MFRGGSRECALGPSEAACQSINSHRVPMPQPQLKRTYTAVNYLQSLSAETVRPYIGSHWVLVNGSSIG
jgi:hypothetical protein